MPINDTGSDLVLGPDQEGRFTSVAPGESYEHPTPPKTVSDLEAEQAEADAAAQADVDAKAAAKQAAADAKAAAKTPPAGDTPSTPITEGQPA